MVGSRGKREKADIATLLSRLTPSLVLGDAMASGLRSRAVRASLGGDALHVGRADDAPTLMVAAQHDQPRGALQHEIPLRNVEREEECRWRCARKDACRSFMHNRYHECYLKNLAEFGEKLDNPAHRTVACARIGRVRHYPAARARTRVSRYFGSYFFAATKLS